MPRLVIGKIGCALSVVLLAVAALSRPAVAHHSFAMFDQSKKLTITGTVAEYQWSNPHVWIYVLGSVGDEAPQKWGMEGISPSMLERHGWRRDDLKVGDKITAVINPLRDGTPGGALSYVIRADGKVLQAYGAPPGTQRAGAEPQEGGK